MSSPTHLAISSPYHPRPSPVHGRAGRGFAGTANVTDDGGHLVVDSIRFHAPPWPGDVVAFPPLASAGVDAVTGPGTPPPASGSTGSSLAVNEATAPSPARCVTSVNISSVPARVSPISDLEGVEEFFGQLWFIPGSPSPPPRHSGGRLWIRKGLIESNSFAITDCFPASDLDRFVPVSRSIQIGPRLGSNSFAEILSRRPMADGRGNRGRGRGGGRGAQPAAPPPAAAVIPVQPPPALVQVALPQRQAPVPHPQQQQQQFRRRNYGSQPFRPRFQNNNQVRPAAPIAPLVNLLPPVVPPPAAPSPPASTEPPEQELDPRYSKMICYNCGDPGHFVGNCVRPKLCFICNLPGHSVHQCPEWHKDHPVAVYLGSANTGLGFYHVDIPEESETQWLNFRNCGVVVIKSGDPTITELEKHLSAIFCKVKRWPWQIRELSAKNFLVRFPPWKKVEDLIEFPAFDLCAEGINVKIKAWDRKTEAESAMKVIWVTIKGIPPEWYAWKTIARCTSTIGVLMDVDWTVVFKSFYSAVRVKVAVRDVSKVPPGRLVEMGEQFYMLTFILEEDNGGATSSGPDPPGPSVSVEINVVSQMDTDQNTAPAGNGGSGNSQSVHPGAVAVRTCGLEIGSEVVGNRNAGSDHYSWNGFANADKDIGDDLVSEESFCSLPAQWDYSGLDDRVWDFDPKLLNMEEGVEDESISLLEQSAANLAYCSGILQDLEENSVDDDEEEFPVSDLLLSPDLCEQVNSARKNLLPILDQMAAQDHGEKKGKWGPAIASRMSTRNHGNVSIMEKAQEYKKKRNLEVAPSFKGKKLARARDALGQGDSTFAKMAGSLQTCSFGAHGEELVAAGKNQK